MKLLELPFNTARASLAGRQTGASTAVEGMRWQDGGLQHGEARGAERVDGCDLRQLGVACTLRDADAETRARGHCGQPCRGVRGRHG